MLNLLRKIVLITCLCSFANEGMAQIKSKGKKKKPTAALPIPKAPDIKGLESIQTVPEGVNKAPQSAPAIIWPEPPEKGPDEILNKFIKKVKGVKYLVFESNPQKYHIDSLFPKIKEYVDSFIQRNKTFKLDFGDYAATGRILNIQNKILSEKQKPYKARDKAVLKEIEDSIKVFPTSKERIDLQLWSTSLSFQNETFYRSIGDALYKAEADAEQIPSFFQKAKAYTYIGDFASYYKEENLAIQMYYLARVWLENSTISELQKNIQQAYICKKIAAFFLYNNEYNSFTKGVRYLEEAGNYLGKSNTVNDYNINWADIFSNQLYFYTKYYQSPQNDTGLYSPPYFQENLQSLNFWNFHYERGAPYASATNYLGLQSIATVLRSQGKYQEALFYYLKALPYAASTDNQSYLSTCIYNISYTYTLLNDEKNALLYSDLNLKLCHEIRYTLSYKYAVLDKAYILSQQKKYNLALDLINQIQFDTTVSNVFLPPFFDELQASVIYNKYSILYSIKSDSVEQYEITNSYYTQSELRRYSNLTEMESSGVLNWQNAIKENEISKKTYKIDSLNNENVNLINFNDTLRNETNWLKDANQNLLTTISAKEAANKKLTAESVLLNTKINKQTSMLKNLTVELGEKKAENKKLDSSNIIISTQLADRSTKLQELEKTSTDITENNRELEDSNTNLQYTRNILYGLIGSLLACAIIVAVLMTKGVKKIKANNNIRLAEEKENTRQKELELKQLDDLAKNKIHNFQNDFHILPNMLHEGEVNQAIRYTDEYGSYQAIFFENWKKSRISLADELILVKQYAKVKEAAGKLLDLHIDSKTINISGIIFIQSVFDTLLDNSLRWGFKDKEEVCKFDVKIEQKNQFIYCTITDNGNPPSDPLSYFRKSDSGLNILRSRIKALFEIKKMSIPKNFFSVNKLEENSGTIIKITMPYEQII